MIYMYGFSVVAALTFVFFMSLKKSQLKPARARARRK